MYSYICEYAAYYVYTILYSLIYMCTNKLITMVYKYMYNNAYVWLVLHGKKIN